MKNNPYPISSPAVKDILKNLLQTALNMESPSAKIILIGITAIVGEVLQYYESGIGWHEIKQKIQTLAETLDKDGFEPLNQFLLTVYQSLDEKTL